MFSRLRLFVAVPSRRPAAVVAGNAGLPIGVFLTGLITATLLTVTVIATVTALVIVTLFVGGPSAAATGIRTQAAYPPPPPCSAQRPCSTPSVTAPVGYSAQPSGAAITTVVRSAPAATAPAPTAPVPPTSSSASRSSAASSPTPTRSSALSTALAGPPPAGSTATASPGPRAQRAQHGSINPTLVAIIFAGLLIVMGGSAMVILTRRAP